MLNSHLFSAIPKCFNDGSIILETSGYATENNRIEVCYFTWVCEYAAPMRLMKERVVSQGYLQILGASRTVIGLVAGFGELIGYCLRLGIGYLRSNAANYSFV
jgi:hypothetical protein